MGPRLGPGLTIYSSPLKLLYNKYFNIIIIIIVIIINFLKKVWGFEGFLLPVRVGLNPQETDRVRQES
jgi:hypothetical protein